MKIFKNLIVIGALILSLGLTACSDPVQDDLINYINNELSKIAELDERIASGYESVSGENYVDDYTTYTEISDNALPLLIELIDKLEDISPQTEEVRGLNEKLIERYSVSHSGMILLLSAIEKKDSSIIVEANEKFDKGKRLQREFDAELEALCEKHDVELSE